MTNHETDGDDKEAILINELEDFLHWHEKIFPELVCFFVLHLALIAIGVRAWFLL